MRGGASGPVRLASELWNARVMSSLGMQGHLKYLITNHIPRIPWARASICASVKRKQVTCGLAPHIESGVFLWLV